MTFAQRRNRLTTHFSERIPLVKRTHICNAYVPAPPVAWYVLAFIP